jgi:MinD-like ATPase involved in chromosome partitioning or flagellar assembly
LGWEAKRVVVRVRGRGREVEVALPGERPVKALLPGLVAICEGAPSPDADGWRLVTAEGRELPLGATLGGAGIADGTALRLWPPGEQVLTAAERHRRLEEVIAARRFWRSTTIAVASPKGGVGKTTVTVVIGAILARLRSERVIAVDADPDYGTLGRSLVPARPMFVDDLARLVDQPALSPAMLDRFLARGPEGLLVLPAPADPRRMDQLDEGTYARVIDRLRVLSPLVLLDCGAGMRGQATRAAIGAADQLVLVTDAEPATVELVADAARDLAGTTRPFSVVVNKVPRSGIDRERLTALLPRARALIELPADRGQARRVAAGKFEWDTAPPAWKAAGRELAAGLVAGWDAAGRARLS